MSRGALLLLTLALCGCNQTKQKPAPAAAAEPPHYFQPDPATAGRMAGSIIFRGTKPAPHRISMDAEEACAALHKRPVYDETVVTGKRGGLANVFVYIKTGLEGKVFAPAAETVTLEQRGCQFLPRVLGLRVAQTLAVKNSDPVSHNVHPKPRNNRDWNQQQAPQAPDLLRRFARPDVMIPVRCDVHRWMKGFIGVVDHPFFAVTDGTGSFEFKGLPPGEYTVAAWHETLGEKTAQATVKTGAEVKLEFVFE